MAGCFGDGRLDPEGPPSRAVGLSLLLGEVIQIPGLSQQTFSIGQGDAAGATQAHLPLVALRLAHSVLQRLNTPGHQTGTPTKGPGYRDRHRKIATAASKAVLCPEPGDPDDQNAGRLSGKISASCPTPESHCLCETAVDLSPFLTPHSGFDSMGACLVSPKTNSPSPAQRTKRAA